MNKRVGKAGSSEVLFIISVAKSLYMRLDKGDKRGWRRLTSLILPLANSPHSPAICCLASTTRLLLLLVRRGMEPREESALALNEFRFICIAIIELQNVND